MAKTPHPYIHGSLDGGQFSGDLVEFVPTDFVPHGIELRFEDPSVILVDILQHFGDPVDRAELVNKVAMVIVSTTL